METFHVYVVGAVDRTGEGLARVAEAIAEHYGLPADDLLGRLSRGRFRVKTGVDVDTAQQYKRDLEQLGARVVIEPVSPSDRPSGTTLPPTSRPATPAAGAPVARPAMPSIGARASTPPPIGALPSGLAGHPRASTPPPVGGLQSGLAAAFSGEHAVSDLSALDRLDGAALSSIDGVADAPMAPASSFGPPPDAPAAAPAKPGKPTAAAAKPARPRDLPVDMDFAPPPEGEELKVDIAPDEIEHRERKRARTPVSVPATVAPHAPMTTPVAGAPVVAAVAAVAPAPPLSVPLAVKAVRSEPIAAVVRARNRLGPLANERVRFAVGVAIAILLGLLPAHLVAGWWERSAYASIDARLERAYDRAADSSDEYDTLDTQRDHELDAKHGVRTNIAIVGILLWAAAGAGIGYLWFRRVPWDELE